MPSRLHTATAERVSLNGALVGQLGLSLGSTAPSPAGGAQRQAGQSFYFQLLRNQIEIPRASLTDVRGAAGDAEQGRRLLESKEILDARQYWSDDEGRHAINRLRRPVRTRKGALAVEPEDTGHRPGPITITALKSRIARQRQLRAAMRAEGSATSGSGEDHAPLRPPAARRQLEESTGPPGKKMAAVDNGHGPHGGANAYFSATNPDVTYRKRGLLGSRSQGWSRSWNEAVWPQEFRAQNPSRYAPQQRDASFRQISSSSTAGNSAPARSKKRWQSAEPVSPARIYRPEAPSRPVAGSVRFAPSTKFRKRGESRDMGDQDSAGRFRKFWVEAVQESSIYSPLDDTVPHTLPEAVSNGSAAHGDAFVRVTVAPPRVVMTAGQGHGSFKQQPPASYQLKRVYGYF